MSKPNSEILEVACDILSLDDSLRSETLELLQSGDEVWNSLIELTSQDLVVSALYPNLLRKLPASLKLETELLEFLEAAYSLNKERNSKIQSQIFSLVDILDEQSIEAVFLKGSGYLISPPPLTSDGRVVGDIDFIVSEEKLYETIQILHENGYGAADGIWFYDYLTTQHYAPLLHINQVAMVEVHEHLVARHLNPPITFDRILSTSNKYTLDGRSILLPSNTIRVLHNILHAQIGESGFYSQHFQLRQLHDFSLLSSLPNIDWQAIPEQFSGPVQREMLYSYLNDAEKYFGWKPPKELQYKSSLLFSIRQKTAQDSPLRKILGLSLAVLGAFCAERIQTHYGATQSIAQLFGFRLKHALHLMKKFVDRSGRTRLLSNVKDGTVVTASYDKQNILIENFGLIDLEDSFLLVHRSTGCSFLLNLSAGLIAEELLAGITPEELAESISEHAGISLEQAREDIQAVYEIFMNSDKHTQNDETPFSESAENSSALLSGEEINSTSIVLLSDLELVVKCEEEFRNIVEFCKSVLQSCLELENTYSLKTITIFNIDGRIRVIAEDGKFIETEDVKELPSILFAHAQRFIAECIEHTIAFHGGAFEHRGEITLVLGQSGSGKTTLLAHLQREGFSILAEDIILLGSDYRSIYSSPLPLGLKQGSWDELDIIPSIEETYQHQTGRKIVYLPLQQTADSVGLRRQITNIIFPTYKADSLFTQRELTRAETILEITNAGFLANSADTYDDLKSLSKTLNEVNSFAFEYSSFRQIQNFLENDILGHKIRTQEEELPTVSNTERS